MNRGGNGTPAGSTCGGMYTKGAQDMCDLDVRCESNNGTVYSVGAEGLARRPARVIGKRKEVTKIRFRVGTGLEERRKATNK